MSNPADLSMYASSGARGGRGKKGKGRRAAPAAAEEQPQAASPAGMDIYFNSPSVMMNRLEKSKPVRTTRTDKGKVKAADDARADGGDESAQMGVFKWQRMGSEMDADPDADDDDDKGVADDVDDNTRWHVLTGNVNPKRSSIAVFLGNIDWKHKAFRPGIVNGKLGAIVADVTSFLGAAGTDPFDGQEPGSSQAKTGLEAFEALNFVQDQGIASTAAEIKAPINWPPEAPKFPPPPPEAFEEIHPVKRKVLEAAAERREGRGRRKLSIGGSAKRLNGSGRNLISSQGQQLLANVQGGGAPRSRKMSEVGALPQIGGVGGSARQGRLSSASSASTAVSSGSGSSKGKKKKSMMRRISMIPGGAAAKRAAAAEQEVRESAKFWSRVRVPYVLPPPPEPLATPKPGSNDERRRQEADASAMGVEDQRSKVMVLESDKRSNSELCVELREQIKQADAEINKMGEAKSQLFT